MPNLEVEVKEKVTKLFMEMSWQQVCLSILPLIAEKRSASKIYNKLKEWEIIDPQNKKEDLKSIVDALCEISEARTKKEVTEMFMSMSWEQVCLSILAVVPEGKLVSKMFIYDELIKWELIDPRERTKNLESIYYALFRLHQERLVKKEDWSQFESEKFERYCNNFAFGTIIKTPKKNRTQLVFRLPTKAEAREARKMNKYYSTKKKDGSGSAQSAQF